MKQALIVLLALSQTVLGATLFLVTERAVEIYDASMPLIPIKVETVEISNVLKVLPGENYLYVLFPTQIAIYDQNLSEVRAVQLNRKAVDMVMLDDLYVLHDYSVSVFDRSLKLKSSFTFNEKLTRLNAYSNMLIALSDGKIVAFDRNFKRIWEITAPDPIVNAQVVGKNLMFSTKKEFYIMNISEGVPTLESKHKFALNFEQILFVRNNFVVLLNDRSLLLLSAADLSVMDKLNISALSVANYKDYLYVLTDKGNLVIVGVLSSSLKLFHTVATNVKWMTVSETDLTKVIVPPQVEISETPAQRQELKEEKLLSFLGEVKLPQKLNTLPAIGKELYLSTLDGNLLRIDPTTLKVQSSKVAFIITADPVILEDGTIILGSWDKAVYMISNKTNKFATESNVSLAAAKTPQGFVVVDDNGILYLSDLKKNEIRKVQLTSWSLCPPCVHDDYGVLVVDWLGVLHLVSFSGVKVWERILEPMKSAEMVVTNELVFVISESTIWCVQIKDGTVRWVQSFEDVSVVQAVSDGVLLYLCDSSGSLRAIDFSGKRVWLKENLFVRTVLSTKAGLLAAGEKLYLLSTKDGLVLLEENLPVPVRGKMKMSDSGLLVLTAEDRLLLYKMNSSPTSGWPMSLADSNNSSALRK